MLPPGNQRQGSSVQSNIRVCIVALLYEQGRKLQSWTWPLSTSASHHSICYLSSTQATLDMARAHAYCVIRLPVS